MFCECSECAQSVPHTSGMPASPSSFCRGQDRAKDAATALHYRASFSLFSFSSPPEPPSPCGMGSGPYPSTCWLSPPGRGTGSPSLPGPAPGLLHPPPRSSHRQPLPPAPPASPPKEQPITFPASPCPRGTPAAQQHACLDGLMQFDFLHRIYSSFLESFFHWRLPERSRWHIRARVRVGLRDGGQPNRQSLPLPPALQCVAPAPCIHSARAGEISAFVE